MIINNNDNWTVVFLKTFKSFFNNSMDENYCEPDLLICDDLKGNISNEKAIKKSFINTIKPYVKNIFILIKFKIICLDNSQSINDLIYDNILYFPISIGGAITNKIINELNIKHGKKIVLPSDDDIDRFYIGNILSQKNRNLIDHFILDCKNIIGPKSLIDYLQMKDQLNILSYTIPLDYQSITSEFDLKNYDYLEMQIFTKPQPIEKTMNVLKIINANQKYIRIIGFFPLLTMRKRLPLILLDFYREIRKIKASFVIFWRDRPLKTYYSQLETFNSLFIQRRGGFTAIKYAIANGLLIFGDSQTPNGKILTNDFGIKVLKLEDFNRDLYNKQDIANILRSNRINLINIIEKSKIFFCNLFSSKNALENFKDN